MEVGQAREQILACRTRLEMIEWVRRSKDTRLDGRLSRSVAKEVGGFLLRSRRGEAAALVLAYALVDADGLVAELRRTGVLRASRYEFRVGGPQELVAVLLAAEDVFKFSPVTIEYLHSLIALYDLGAEARKTRDGLVRRMKTRRGKALKSYLVMANQVFANGWQNDPHAPSAGLEHYSSEDISDAVSRLIVIHRESLRTVPKDWQYTDPQALNPLNSTYTYDLLDALHLNELIKAETLIDGLPYRAVRHSNGIVVESIDPRLERSVRLGYVQTDLQGQFRRQEMEREWQLGDAPVSFSDACVRISKALEQIVVYKSEPVPRLTLRIPNDPLFFAPIAADVYFKEDMLMLLQLSVHDYDESTPEPFEITSGITSIDLFKVTRLFAFLGYAMGLGLQKVEDPKRREALTLSSVIPIFPREALIELLQGVLPPEKAAKVYELLRFDESRDYADLQYMPFICVGDRVLVAPALLANSNLVRNITMANGLNKDRIGSRDPMQCAVVEALRSAQFLVEEDVGLSKDDHDIDILAYRDGILYAFECKNAYHPCNAHEMRNSYDYIEYAGQQLTLRRTWLDNPTNQLKLFSKVGWSVPATTSIRTAIIIANRVFTGASINGHPVRQAHEFINVVARGFIRASDGSERVFWDGDEVTTADVDRYLGDGGLLADHFSAMLEFNYDYRIGDKLLRFRSWMFDMKRHQETVQKYRVRLAAKAADVDVPT